MKTIMIALALVGVALTAAPAVAITFTPSQQLPRPIICDTQCSGNQCRTVCR